MDKETDFYLFNALLAVETLPNKFNSIEGQ
jgi:hypothetical protein